MSLSPTPNLLYHLLWLRKKFLNFSSPPTIFHPFGCIFSPNLLGYSPLLPNTLEPPNPKNSSLYPASQSSDYCLSHLITNSGSILVYTISLSKPPIDYFNTILNSHHENQHLLTAKSTSFFSILTSLVCKIIVSLLGLHCMTFLIFLLPFGGFSLIVFFWILFCCHLF